MAVPRKNGLPKPRVVGTQGGLRCDVPPCYVNRNKPRAHARGPVRQASASTSAGIAQGFAQQRVVLGRGPRPAPRRTWNDVMRRAMRDATGRSHFPCGPEARPETISPPRREKYGSRRIGTSTQAPTRRVGQGCGERGAEPPRSGPPKGPDSTEGKKARFVNRALGGARQPRKREGIPAVRGAQVSEQVAWRPPPRRERTEGPQPGVGGPNSLAVRLQLPAPYRRRSRAARKEKGRRSSLWKSSMFSIPRA